MARQRSSSGSNRDLLEHINYSLGLLGDAVIALERQQKELADRIAFIAPTQSDITREVEAFIDKSLAA